MLLSSRLLSMAKQSLSSCRGQGQGQVRGICSLHRDLVYRLNQRCWTISGKTNIPLRGTSSLQGQPVWRQDIGLNIGEMLHKVKMVRAGGEGSTTSAIRGWLVQKARKRIQRGQTCTFNKGM